MAAKLEYEVGVKTENARRKIKHDLSTVEVGASGDGRSAPGQSAAAADKAARSLNNLANSADKAAPSFDKAVKAFAGIGISMAASYAANFLPEGSMARTAVGYGGNMLGGAVSGAAFGPWGAIAGAAAGAGKTYMENEGQEKSAKLDFFASELRHKEAMDWKERFQSLTDLGEDPSSDLAGDKLREVREALAEKKESEAKLIDDIKKYIENGEYYSADFAKQSLAINRAQQAQLETAAKGMEKKMQDLEEPVKEKASLSPADSLSRIGGDFVGAQAVSLDSVARNTSLANSILGRIERKMQKGGTF